MLNATFCAPEAWLPPLAHTMLTQNSATKTKTTTLFMIRPPVEFCFVGIDNNPTNKPLF
jgi:hypothetical protein